MGDPAGGELLYGGCARAEARSADRAVGDRAAANGAAPGEQAVVVDQRQQADAEAGCEQGGVTDERSPGGAVLVGRGESLLDRVHGSAEHVPKQEREDADRERVEQCPQRRSQPAHPADRQPDEDRETGDRAKGQDPACAHPAPFVARLLRVTLLDVRTRCQGV